MGQVLLWAAIGSGALLLLAKSVQNSSEFGRLQPWILLLNSVGVIALTVLLARKLWQLVRDYRAHVPGSRLTARTVSIFGALVIAPAAHRLPVLARVPQPRHRQLVPVEVKQGLNDALLLSRAALDLRMREYCSRTEAFADARRSRRRARAGDARCAAPRQPRLEISLFGPHGRILGAASRTPSRTAAQPPPDLLRQMEQRLPYVSLEPQIGGQYLIRIAAPLPRSSAHDARFVVAIYEVPRSWPRSPRRYRLPTPSTATWPRCASR